MKISRLQAIKALKEEGIDTVVINPNVATVQVKQYIAYMQNQQNICKTSKMYAKQVNKEEYFMRFLIECAVNTSDIHGLVCSIVICLELTFMLLISPIHSDKQGSR